MRYAIYFTPPETDPLARAAASWLGRSAFRTAPGASREIGGLASEEATRLTAEPRRYGFHATVKAPFRLADGADLGELDEALAAFCRRATPFELQVTLDRLVSFFALVPEYRDAALDELARDVVIGFEHFRAPLSDAEIERRRPDQLSAGQLRNLHQWGYPYVLDEFRFHMTLTDRVADADAPRIRRAIETHFGPLLEEPLEIDGLALFAEPTPGAPFEVHSLHRFGIVPAQTRPA